ncbi:hypothetical protein J5N97_012355 [Dioscorea zingiberensis]|uniref:Uncharacterized protein n=1 Tax=Dioscorea zingiberensis TaxID=325984 RepID=A0A9D5CNT9_9LILI|nr:hypothetical protein J5N97_012355 [Dioscorea zingiberensis]
MSFPNLKPGLRDLTGQTSGGAGRWARLSDSSWLLFIRGLYVCSVEPTRKLHAAENDEKEVGPGWRGDTRELSMGRNLGRVRTGARAARWVNGRPGPIVSLVNRAGVALAGPNPDPEPVPALAFRARAMASAHVSLVRRLGPRYSSAYELPPMAKVRGMPFEHVTTEAAAEKQFSTPLARELIDRIHHIAGFFSSGNLCQDICCTVLLPWNVLDVPSME